MNQKHDIHERIYRFVLRVLGFTKRVPTSNINQVLVGQLIRAITSTGANDQEADGAFSKADFIHCYVLVRKEEKESLYWIRMIGDSNQQLKKEAEELLIEGDEIVRIVTVIILNTRKNK